MAKKTTVTTDVITAATAATVTADTSGYVRALAEAEAAASAFVAKQRELSAVLRELQSDIRALLDAVNSDSGQLANSIDAAFDQPASMASAPPQWDGLRFLDMGMPL